MEMLTLGAAGRSRREAARLAIAGDGTRILEIGCGTGALTRLLLDNGASVLAIDENPEMLDLAVERIGAGRPGLIFEEKAAAEIDALAAGSFDTVAAAFSLSEMSGSERSYVLREAVRLLVDGGRVVVLDETLPGGRLARALVRVLRLPLVALAWVVTGRVSSPLRDTEGELRAAGLSALPHGRYLLGTIALFEGRKAGRKDGAT